MSVSRSETHYDFEKSLKNVQAYPFIHKYLPFDRYAIRPPAALIVKAVFKTAVTPNQLTLASFFFALLSGVAFTGGRPLFFALGGTLALISTIFDAADGMLARAKQMTSRYGAFLDLFLDRIADFAVLAGGAYGYYRYSRSQTILVFGLVTVALYFLQLSLHYIEMQYLRSEKYGEGAEAKSLAVSFIFVASLAGRPDFFLAAIFLMSVTAGISKASRFLKRGRDAEETQAP
jgi:CDP-L-myo-inositol myo-inositolphosphotransferase